MTVKGLADIVQEGAGTTVIRTAHDSSCQLFASLKVAQYVVVLDGETVAVPLSEFPLIVALGLKVIVEELGSVQDNVVDSPAVILVSVALSVHGGNTGALLTVPNIK